MKTLLNYLNEAKLDDEYAKNYEKFIPRDLFNTIIMMDPKTTVINGQPQGIGFVAKNLLLPCYMKGEKEVDLDSDELKSLISQYYDGLSKYPKPREFKSVADFITFMQNPDEAEIETNIEVKENPIDVIYNKYWTKIPREEFDKIISMDPGTTDNQIGEIARNFLLPKYSAGERWILKDQDSIRKVTNAIKTFAEEKNSYDIEKQNIRNYASIEEFVNYKPVSLIVAAVPNLVEGTDYLYLASTPEYDVFKPLTFQASRDLAHTQNSDNVWCTAGGSNGRQYIGSDGISTYWNSYKNQNKIIYEFINKTNPSDRLKNYNLALNKSDSTVSEFRNGNNTGGYSDEGERLFKSLLLKNKNLTYKLSTCDDEIMRKCPALQSVLQTIELADKPLIIKNELDMYKSLSLIDTIKEVVEKIQISNVDEILPGIFANMSNLQELNISNVKVIGFEAFKSCTNLSKLTLNEPLEVIEEQAFANCSSLQGSVRLPDTVKRVGEKAFEGTHVRLKINKDRTTPIKFSKKDEDWVNIHVKSINVQ